MKMLGKRSVSSVLKVTLDVLIFITIVLGALSIFLLLMAALSGNTAPHDEFVNLEIPYKLDKTGRQPEIQPLEATLGGMALGMEVSRELTVNLTKWWFLLLIVIFTSVLVGVFLFILFQLRHLLASLTEGNPFIIKNAKRLRIIGLVIIIGELFFNLTRICTAVIIDASARIEGAKLVWSELISGFSLPTLFLGIVILIIAEIFRLGVYMREEQELTI